MKAVKPIHVLTVLLLTMGACSSGSRLGGDLFEENTPDGIWRQGGTLIRSYDVNLTTAYEAIETLAMAENWKIDKRSSEARTAYFGVVTSDKINIDFRIWAPAGKATDIGIMYSKGDRIQSSKIFEKLEKVLPPKSRVQGNK